MACKHVQHEALRTDRVPSDAGGLSTLVREEGVRAAYRGLQPTILALLPTWALYFSVYEFLKRSMKASSAGAQLIFAACSLCQRSSLGHLGNRCACTAWQLQQKLKMMLRLF